MSEIPPSVKVLTEALNLSSEILKNIELSEIPLTNIFLKASRLARLVNDFDIQNIMDYEASGYPSTPTGIEPPIWQLVKLAGRTYKVEAQGEVKELGYTASISELEEQLRLGESALTAARDRDISISSANPSQYVVTPTGNWFERQTIRQAIETASKQIANRRGYVYRYVLRKHYELKYSGVAEDAFSRIRDRVDSLIGDILPDAVKKFLAVHDNLISENPENWANAVHSCRRVLQDLADAVFPATTEVRTKTVDGKKREIKLGKDNYKNRIIAYVEDNSSSGRFKDIVGSHLHFLGDRLDSIFEAAQKGSHNVVYKEEADRYVVYTYLLVGDILSIKT